MFQEQEVSVGAWFVFYILSAIPGVNVLVWLIFYIVARSKYK